jgi:hypothetical protein
MDLLFCFVLRDTIVLMVLLMFLFSSPTVKIVFLGRTPS